MTNASSPTTNDRMHQLGGRRSAILAAIVVSLLSLGACKPVGIDQSDPAAKAKAAADAKKAEEVVFPAEMPSYVPLYPGAKRNKNPGAGATNAMLGKMLPGTMVVFTSEDSSEKILGFYSAALKKAGLIDEGAISQFRLEGIVYRKDASDTAVETVTVMVNKLMPGVTMVQIMHVSIPLEGAN
jgi:hypothetical protein